MQVYLSTMGYRQLFSSRLLCPSFICYVSSIAGQIRSLVPLKRGFRFWFGTVAVIPIQLSFYICSQNNCWLNRYPYKCKQSSEFGPEDVNCERGEVSMLCVAASVIPYWILLLASTVTFYRIYCAVRHTEDLSLKYAPSLPSLGNHLPTKRKLARALTEDVHECESNTYNNIVCRSNNSNIEHGGEGGGVDRTTSTRAATWYISRNWSRAVDMQALAYITVYVLPHFLASIVTCSFKPSVKSQEDPDSQACRRLQYYEVEGEGEAEGEGVIEDLY
jgi:hypothetical protein